MRAPRVLALALAAALAAAPGRAQDFACAEPAGPRPGAGGLLEDGLPCGAGGPALATGVTRWLGLSGFETRRAALAAGPGSWRVAVGLAQTGDPELGWTALGVALGGCGRDGGAALRAVGRRDRSSGPLVRTALAHDGGLGLEAGAGAWLAPARGTVVWAGAPQLATTGEAPPLARPLQLGVRCAGAGGAAWLALAAPRAGDDGERLAGLALGRGGLTLWAEARDGPLRAALGVRAALGAVAVAAEVDAHPVLGETTHLALAWCRPGAAPP